jgi:NADPH2:quinone reductase
MQATKIKGKIVNVGRLAGGTTDFNCDLHALRRINYLGVTFRTRSIDEIRGVYSNMWEDLGDLVTTGKLSLPIEKVFDFKDVTQALSCMRDNEHFGKLILKL